MRELNDEKQILLNKEFAPELIRQIQLAQFSIDIVAYEWHFGDVPIGSHLFYLNLEIKRAKERGLKIRAIVRKETIANRLKKAGIKAKVYRGKNLLHPKILIFDRERIFCGSHNLTKAGLTSNVEISIMTQSKEIAEKAISFFEELWR